MLRILVPLDTSPASQTAVAEALGIATAFRSEIHLLRVLDTHPSSHGQKPDTCAGWQLMREQAEHCLSDICASIAPDKRSKVTHIEVREGNAAAEILRYSEEQSIDLIVMSTFGESGGDPFPHGGVTLKLLASCDNSVLLVNPAATPGFSNAPACTWIHDYEHVLIGLDGTRESTAALQLGVAVAQSHKAKITIVDCVPPIKLPDRLADDLDAGALKEKLERLLVNRSHQQLTEAKAMLPAGLDSTVLTISTNNPEKDIGVLARKSNVDLVIAAHAFSGGKFDVTQNPLLVSQLGCPLFILKGSCQGQSLQHYRSAMLPEKKVAGLHC